MSLINAVFTACIIIVAIVFAFIILPLWWISRHFDGGE